MKLPISWLRQWVEYDGTPEQVAEALTTRGFYVEGVEQHGRRYPGIVVARVLEAEKHPNADKLKLCRVDGGAGELRIVCGAPNVSAGMLVALATLGTTMPNGLVIKAAKIRGEESQGMLCSARELMVSEEHAGILDLREFLAGADLVPGRPIDAYLPEPDAVLEVEVPFNRPDGLGVIGLAREVKAALGGRWSAWARDRFSAQPASDPARVTFDLEVADPSDCPSYFAQVVEGVHVAPSPPWLVRQLEAMGQRSINNIVDLTNLVLFEFGQPLHAFDLDKLAGPAIRVRRAAPGETLTTLDDKPHTLGPEVVVIADKKGAVALGGVMGGAASEVTSATHNLLLECADFRPQQIRRAARSLDMATEASKRYERGVDAGLADAAAARFLTLLLELCPDARLQSWRRRREAAPPRTLTLRASRCQRLVGLPFTPGPCADLLESLEFGVQRSEPLIVTIPSWRPDVTLEDDLVEEVARSHGYDRIPDAKLETGGSFATRTPRERTVRRAREGMLARGLHEAWCSSMVSEREAVESAALFGDDPARLVRLANPMSRESEVLRPNLLPGLLRAVAHNLRQGQSAVRLFEVGAGILWTRGHDPAKPGLPEETPMLAAVVTGPRLGHAHDAAQQPVDFFDAKGLLEAWLGEMRVDAPRWHSYAAAGWKLGASAEVAVGTSRVAWAGQLAPKLLQSWEIDAPVFAMVAHLEPFDAAAPAARATLPGRFPPVRRDLAFFVPRAVTHAQVEQAIGGAAGGLPCTIELFDVYEGPGTPAGMKSLAYALQFQHAERTLAEAEVEGIQERMVAAVAKDCGGQLREKA